MRWLLPILLAAGCGSGEPDFELIAPTETVTITPGQIGQVDVAIDRTGGFDRTVVVTASGLRAGITPGALSLTPGLDSGVLELAVETSAEPGPIDGAFLLGAAGDLERTAPVSITIESR